MFDIICSLSWLSRDKCCDLPATVRTSVTADLRHVFSRMGRLYVFVYELLTLPAENYEHYDVIS